MRLTLVCLSMALPAALAALKQDLSTLMPKDQLSTVQSIGKCNELDARAGKEKNGLRKQELEDQIANERKACGGSLYQDMNSVGLQGWVGFATPEDKHLLVTDGKSFRIYFDYKGMTEEVRKSVRQIEAGTVIRFDVPPKAKTLMNTPTANKDGGTYGHYRLVIRFPGSALKAVGGAVK